MSEWKARRFWRETSVAPAGDGGFAIHLDARPLRTPAKAALAVPTRALAELIAAEWDAQDEVINPLSMPMTRSANAAVDKTAPQFDAVVDIIAAYGETDLLCHRAAAPEALAARQARDWDPLLTWCATTFGAPLNVTCGVIAAAQPADSLARLRREIRACGPFGLTALSDLVALSGSLVVGLAAVHGVADGESLWAVSRLDETWQEEQWGVDAQAQEAAALRKAAFLHALAFFRASSA